MNATWEVFSMVSSFLHLEKGHLLQQLILMRLFLQQGPTE